jgi:ubiquinone/menaquinone biosynthesis C-methylase UbiE
MSSYNIFAKYYDRLTENADYKVRSDYISGFFNHGKVENILEIACGTGSFTKELCKKGYNVTACDLSDSMLTIAKSKCPDAKFLKCDMRSFDFEGNFDACICMLDSINHLTDIEDWKRCFDSVWRSVKKDGLFIFDVNTVYKHNIILADNSFIFDEEDFFLAWDNELLDGNIVRIFLDFFIFNGINYDRYSEEFEELALDSEEIKAILIDKFEIIGIYDDLTLNPERQDSERLYFVCKRK